MANTQGMFVQPKKKPSRNGAATSPETIAAKVRAAKALELRLGGLGFPEIAKQVGYNSRQAAHDAVSRALDSIIREPAETLRKLDLERLDRLWQIQYLNAQSGDVNAMAACMKIMERRAKLLGLDAPVRQELTGSNGGPIKHQNITPAADLTPEELAAELARYGIDAAKPPAA